MANRAELLEWIKRDGRLESKAAGIVDVLVNLREKAESELTD